MIEWIGRLAASLEAVSVVVIAGMTFFWWLCGTGVRTRLPEVERRLVASLIVALFVFITAQLIQLPVQFAAVIGSPDAAWQAPWGSWREYIAATRPGMLWLIRTLMGVALLVVVASAALRARRPLLPPQPMSSRLLGIISIAGTAITGSGALAGHYAGDENASFLVPVHVAHMAAVALWVGSLPVWWMTVRAEGRQAGLSGESFSEDVTQAVLRFSRIAMLLVVILVATGVLLADQFIDNQGDLFGTPWGLLLTVKITLLAAALLAANAIRRDLPHWSIGMVVNKRTALRAVRIEWAATFLAVALAAILGQMTPASHEQALWVLPFRFSFEAIALDRIILQMLWAGVWVAMAALLAVVVAFYRHSSRVVLALYSILFAVGAGTALWALAVPAFPDTFQRSDVTYMSESVANGELLFRENCTVCHGAGGHGDGPLSTRTRRPPADLSAPHTALHTAGDMFWWIGNGIPAGGMPGFADRLNEQDRWDLVNFLRTFSQGFQARVLESHVVPDQGWLAAPDFYLVDQGGNLSQLKALRGVPVLLVLDMETQDAMSARIDALKVWHKQAEKRLEIVHVTANPEALTALRPDIWYAQSPRDVFATYELLTRTLTMRGDVGVLGVPRRHAEFLLDRYGYIRARWLPDEDPAGWALPEALAGELDQLAADTRVPPPPDDHLH